MSDIILSHLNMVHLSEKDLILVKSILSEYPCQFYIFGSRVKGAQKKYSDLDLCYKDALPDAIVAKIQEAFEESDLHFKVELLDWNRCDADFQNRIKNDLVRVEDAKSAEN